MMGNLMEYKGYHTKIEFDVESMSLRGKIEGINDYVDFEAEDVVTIEKEFHSAVDDYLEFCAEVGKEPEKEYKGTFNVRISPDLHKKLAIYALKDGRSLNSEVEKAIALFVDNDQSQTRELAESVRNLTETIRMDNAYYGNETTVYSNNVIPFTTVKHTYYDEVKTQ
ncbi:type II toxin-antitoxin system HicB family antitoxin [Coprococcus hominis (ex Arizal et al. 2022)]|jgi:predicted HicB family RNase H-like nuclease|uniref:type II toxin-antitoxin system HicB family antitoxin n=1 Tax=Coprococcus hominis (ex Arizal et al. 2022) TaxID=2881262 RepID=UPI0032C04E4E